jgi:hypothetical protein
MPTPCGPMPTPCQPHANPMPTPCQPHTNPMPTPCDPIRRGFPPGPLLRSRPLPAASATAPTTASASALPQCTASTAGQKTEDRSGLPSRAQRAPTKGPCPGSLSRLNEPAAGDHSWGGWGGQGSRWLGPQPQQPTRSCQTWLCSGNESPTGRGAGGCHFVASCGRGRPPAEPEPGVRLGLNWSPGRLVVNRARCGGRCGG